MYEFLVKHVTECLVENDIAQAKKTTKLIKKHFKKGTELYREFRLFNALINTYVEDRDIAGRIISEAKNAARSYNREALDKEKSLLIRSINHTFKSPNFYNKQIKEYKTYATVQTLINDWRSDMTYDIARTAIYESSMTDFLLQPKEKNILAEQKTKDADPFTVGLMLRKFETKYENVLNNEQIALINSYVYSEKSNDKATVEEQVEKIRMTSLNAIQSCLVEQNNPDVLNKLNEVKLLIETPVSVIDDKILTRYLRVSKLKYEIIGE